MRPFLVRELTVVVRTPAYAIAIGFNVVLLLAFLVVWGDGMPVLPAASVYEQLLIVESGFLAILVPWMAARCGTRDRGDAIVLLSAITATPPSHVLLGRGLGRALASGVMVCAGAPLMIVARHMSGVPAARLSFDIGILLCLSAAAALLTSWCMTTCRNRLGGWLAAGGSTAMVWFVSRISVQAAVAILLFGAGLVVLDVLVGADARYRYLSETGA